MRYVTVMRKSVFNRLKEPRCFDCNKILEIGELYVTQNNNRIGIKRRCYKCAKEKKVI